MEKNYFSELNSVNVGAWIERKNGLSYVSWANAWAEVKKRYPDSTYTVYQNKDGWIYHTDGRTCWVATGVTVNGIEHIEYLPVMDFRNASIPAEKVTSFDVNKAIQRSLTKAVARHGLGLYVYAGEDLPEEEKGKEPRAETPTFKRVETIHTCSVCGKPVTSIEKNGKVQKTAAEVAEWSKETFGTVHCWTCAKKKMDEREGQ